MKVVFLGSHCDDIELGCGATINKNKNNWDIYCFTFSSHELNLSNISKKSLELIGCKNLFYLNFKTNNFWQNRQEIWEKIKNIENSINPDWIFTHCKDEHQDHEVIYNETIRNFKNKNIILYKPSMYYISKFNINYLQEIKEENLQKKIDAIKLYTNYSEKSYCNSKNIESQARVVGMSSNIKLAEGFEIYRLISNI